MIDFFCRNMTASNICDEKEIRNKKEICLVSLPENFEEVEIFELQM